jgi:hypothetical protein
VSIDGLEQQRPFQPCQAGVTDGPRARLARPDAEPAKLAADRAERPRSPLAPILLVPLVMMSSRWARRALLVVGLLLSACAAPKRPPENVTAARLQDSAPEKRAGAREATPGLEDEDARWGIAAAQERKRERDQKRDDKSEQRRKAAAMTDIRATPTFGVVPVVPTP